MNCLNLRSESLIKLNRKEEARQTMDKALERDAENAGTHASNGWNYLEAGDHKKALEHFTMALQLEPMNHSAKVGMKEALKAKKPFYRMFLRYSFFMSKLKSGTQWILVLGAYFGVRYLGTLAQTNPEFEIYIIPVVILYTLFALSTWVISPLANLFLRSDPQGKFALDEQEIRVGNFTAGSVALMLIGLVITLYGFFLAEPPNAFHPADWKNIGYAFFGFGFLMLLPLATLLNATNRNRGMIRVAAVVLACLGVFAVYSVSTGAELIGTATMPFLFSMFLYQFLGSYLASKG